MKPELKLVAKARYIQMTADMADRIWREHYARRFNKKQLDAILENLQSVEAIEDDMDRDVNYQLIMQGSQVAGYIAWEMTGGLLLIKHFYLESQWRGKGIGRTVLQSIERLARADGKTAVGVRVGQKQLDTQGFFKGAGFRILHPVDTELAPGILWPEYWMEKRL